MIDDDTQQEDPIADLVDSLEADGRPQLAWVVKWSARGSEPVHAAWNASSDPGALAGLLAFQRGIRAGEVLDALLPVSRWRAGFVWDLERPDGRSRVRYAGNSPDRVCDVIRNAVPTPPTLDELLRIARAIKSR